MLVAMKDIPLRDVLHFLGWKGTPLDEALVQQLHGLIEQAIQTVEPRAIQRRFLIDGDRALVGTSFVPEGQDVQAMLAGCREAVLIAGTLGAQSERMLLRAQAEDAGKALLLDAVLSAGIEAVMDAQEAALRAALQGAGLFLTDRFSPGYGDMPIGQTRDICDVLDAQRQIGLTVSQRGIMMPRKSVTAVMGISMQPVKRRVRGCAACSARAHCMLCRIESGEA